MTPLSSTAPTKRGFGCLGYGCLIAVTLTALLIGGLLFGARMAIRNAAERFTTEQPVAVPTLSLNQETRRVATEQLKNIGNTLFGSPDGGEVRISQDVVRLYVEDSPFRGSVFLELKGDKVFGTFSFPLKALGEWNAARPILGSLLNRYVTGSASAKIVIDSSVATVTMDSLVLNGQTFDGDAIKEANEWVSGFVNSLKDDKSDEPALARIGSMRIENGEAIIKVLPVSASRPEGTSPTPH